jgi:putative aldouronate transport system permease protein
MRIRESAGNRLFDAIVSALLFLALLIVLFPILYIVSASFSNPRAVIAGRVWLLPVEPTLVAYQAVFRNSFIVGGYLNSLFYVVAGTSVSLLLTILGAFPLSRKEFYGRRVFMGIFVFTMLFLGGLIPTYLLVKSLGLNDTRLAMILPNAMGIWNVLITRTYFQSNIPDELYEAAGLDGCGDMRFLSTMLLPLSGPIIAVMTLYYAVGIWNSYFDALIYLKRSALYPLQIVLRNILIINQIDANTMRDVEELARRQGLAESLKYALIVVASAPLLIVYPFVQKYFIKGIMIGSLKG